MTTKHSLTIELNTTATASTQLLQNIKDAMVHAMMQKIETTGIQDGNDPYFKVWQTIYLEAHHSLTVHFAEPLP